MGIKDPFPPPTPLLPSHAGFAQTGAARSRALSMAPPHGTCLTHVQWAPAEGVPWQGNWTGLFRAHQVFILGCNKFTESQSRTNPYCGVKNRKHWQLWA